MNTFENKKPEENNRFLSKIIDLIVDFKKKLFEQMEDEVESIEKILPLFHLLIYVFTYYKFSDKDKMR